MIKLKITGINEYYYTFKDIYNNTYNLNVEFYEFEPKIDDIIYISDKVIKEKNIYAYGKVNGEYTRNDVEDVIKIERGNESFYLQRYYG